MERPAKIKYTDEQESFGMSGPYLANCYLFDKKLKHRFLVDNYLISVDNNYLVLNRFYTTKPKKVFGLFSFGGTKRDFRIIVCDLNANEFYISKQSYSALYLQEIKEKTITIYQAFHNKLPEYKMTTVFSEATFDKVGVEEVFE